MALKNDDLVTLYRNLVRARKLDEVTRAGVYSGKVTSFYHSGMGQEAVGVGACTFLRREDWVVYTHRYPATPLAKGLLAKAFLAEHYGKETGCCHGRAGWHCTALEIGLPGLSGTMGGCFPVAAGLGIACKRKGAGQVVVCFFGDGTGNRGTLHEAMLMAANWKLPIVWVCENNGLAAFVPAAEAYPMEDVAGIASSYRMPGVVVDGQEVVAVYEATHEAVERARGGGGPSLVECKTLRFRPHMEGFPDIRPPEVLEAMAKRDPVLLFRDKLLGLNVLNEALIAKIDAEAAQEMEDARQFAEASPWPNPGELYRGLYAD